MYVSPCISVYLELTRHERYSTDVPLKKQISQRLSRAPTKVISLSERNHLFQKALLARPMYWTIKRKTKNTNFFRMLCKEP